MKKLYILLTITFLSCSVFAGDILFLNDSVSYEGKVKSISNCKIDFKFQNKIYEIPTSNFKAIKLEKTNGKLYRKFQKMAKDTFSLADEETCIKAQDDAQALHYSSNVKFMNVVYGFFVPVASEIIGAIVIKPNFDEAININYSDHKELHNDPTYLKCYLKRAKSELISMRLIGTGTLILVSLFAITFI